MGLEMLLRKKSDGRDEGRHEKRLFSTHPTKWLLSARAPCSVAPPLLSTFFLVLQACK